MNYTYGGEHGKACINGHYYDRVIPNYFDAKDFPFRAEKEGWFFYIGRMISRKGVWTAIRATEAIGAKLVLAGQTSPEINVKELPSHCEFIGYVEPEQRADLMGRAKAVFVPTLYLEAFGGVNAESQLCLPGEAMVYGQQIKPIKDVQEGDLVLSHDGKLHSVTKKYQRPFRGELIRFRARYSLPLSLTPEHPVLVKRATAGQGIAVRWTRAGEVKTGDMVFIPKTKFGQHSYLKKIHIWRYC